MTKEAYLNTTQIEVKAWNRIKLFFTELDFYKWITRSLVVILGCVLGFFGNISWKYFKKRNNKIDKVDEIDKKADKALKEIKEIKKSLIIHSEKTKEDTPLAIYVQRLSHKIDNQDIAEASAFEEILIKLDDIINTKLKTKNEKRNKN